MRGNEFEIDMIAVNAFCDSITINAARQGAAEFRAIGNHARANAYLACEEVVRDKIIDKANRIIALREMV